VSLDIKCGRCNCTIVHHCESKDPNDSDSPRERVIRFYTWGPTDGKLGDDEMHAAFLASAERNGWGTDTEPGSDTHPAPFFGSQAWSYALLGSKEEARSFHAQIDNLVRAFGFDPHEMKQIAAERIGAARRETVRARNRSRAIIAFKKLSPEMQDVTIHEGGLVAAYQAFPEQAAADDSEFFEHVIDLARIYAERRETRGPDWRSKK
jgi:hypothetical protein